MHFLDIKEQEKKNMMPTTRFLQTCLVPMSLTLQAPKMTSRVP